MRLLILGYSSIAERRVIPAASKVAAIDEISIASKGRPQPNDWPKAGRFFTDYRTALHESGSDTVYVSLPNSMHEQFVMMALAAGKHVIVDKPGMITLEASERAVNEARRTSRVLAEATVFGYHPQFKMLADFVTENGPLICVDAQFIIPPLPIANFRNSRELGGGCLLDMGPYAAGVIRLLGGGSPSHIMGLVGNLHPETGVDMGFSVQARLSNGGIFSGHFSFDGEYQNRLLVVARSGSVIIERVFTPPADHKTEWRRRVRNVESAVTFEVADTFALFLESVARAVASGDHEGLHRNLLDDAECRERIAKALLNREPAQQCL